MPDCASAGKRECNKPCTEHIGSEKKAWLKDCTTGNIYYGDTYQQVLDKQKRILELRASGKAFPGVKPKKHPISIPPRGTGRMEQQTIAERLDPEGITPATSPDEEPDSNGGEMNEPEPEQQETETGDQLGDFFKENKEMIILAAALTILILVLAK